MARIQIDSVQTPTLTKSELADQLYERIGFNKRESKDMVDAFFDRIRDALARGEDVKLSGFGHFQLREKAQRPGRNPRTGEIIPIAARRVVIFHASHKFKYQLQNSSSANQLEVADELSD